MESKVTFFWVAMDEATDDDNTPLVLLLSQEPKRYGRVWDREDRIESFGSRTWRELFPDIKIYPGDCLKIKRTSLPNGFMWEVCDE